MMLRGIISVLALAIFCAVARAETRLALVIGVRDYDSRELISLPNALNDARAIHAALQHYGFNSELVENPTRRQLRVKLSEMWDVRGADDADVALIFFAGHGVTFNSQGYLLAKDSVIAGNARPNDTDEVPVAKMFEAVGRARQAIILLDACRTSPAMSARLAFISNSSVRAGLPLLPRSGSIISYSAEIGMNASDGATPDSSNSPYSEALLAHIGDANLEIADLLKRVRVFVENATAGRAAGPQRPLYEDRRAPGARFYFAAQRAPAITATTDRRRVPMSPDALDPREAIGKLARLTGVQRGLQLRQLLTSPGIAPPLSVDETLALLGDVPADGGRRSSLLVDLLPLLDLPLHAPAAELLIDGLAGNSRYTALLHMTGCLARPIDDADAARLVEGMEAAQVRGILSRLARPQREVCGGQGA